MIKDKVIAVRKSNSFDRGWALVTPYTAAFSKNKRFHALSVSDIVRAITRSTRVNLILSEPCLSSNIVRELEWVGGYATINVIAKNREIVKRYPRLKFNEVKIDESVDFNYIAVKGQSELYALIAQDCVAADSGINAVYFENAEITADGGFLSGAKRVIFADERANKDYEALLGFCIKEKISAAYLVGTKAYNRGLVHKFLKSDVKLLCADGVRNGVVYSTDDGKLYCANMTDKGVYACAEIENADYYLGQPYESLKLADDISVSDIPDGAYLCENGKVTPLKIADEKVIRRTVQIAEMEDFISAKFDRSETDGHNRYCTEAKSVVYEYTLVPPLFDTDKKSDIYGGVKAVYAQWRDNLKSVNLSEIKDRLKELDLSESGLYLLCEEIEGFDGRIAKAVENYGYKNYYAEIKAFTETVGYCPIEDYCKEAFSKLNAERSGTKFDEIDAEIAGYMRTIEERKALIAKGTDVLSNRRRVENLEKRISDLTEMKRRFSGSAAARDGKQLDAFMELCGQVIGGSFVEEKRETDSIGNVLAVREESKISRLESFVKAYLYGFNKFLCTAKDILKAFAAVEIPTNYVVYEQDEKRVIAIESEREYYDTEEIRNRFNLNCKARR